MGSIVTVVVVVLIVLFCRWATSAGAESADSVAEARPRGQASVATLDAVDTGVATRGGLSRRSRLCGSS